MGYVEAQATSTQCQFWLLQQLQPSSTAYNIPCLWKVSGDLDVSCLAAAFGDLAIRHATLRTTFSYRDDRLLQCVHDQRTVDFDSRVCTEDGLDGHVAANVRHRFDLELGPLWFVRVWQTQARSFALLWVMHHTIVDLATKALFSRDLSVLYRSRILNKMNGSVATEETSLAVEDAAIGSMVQIAAQEATWQSTSEQVLCEKYFAEHLRGRIAPLELPQAGVRPTQRPLEAGCVPLELGDAATARLSERCRDIASSPFLWLLAVWGLLLARYGSSERVVVGVPFSNRRKWNSSAVAGCLIKTLPVCIEVRRDDNFGQLLGQIRSTMLEHHRRQEVSLSRLETALALPHDPINNPIYQAGFTFEPPMQLALHGSSVTGNKVHNGGAQLNVFLTLWPSESGYSGNIEYASDRISRATAEDMASSFRELLEHTLEVDGATRVPVGRLRLLAAAEYDRILNGFNSTRIEFGEPKKIHQLFLERAYACPEASALRCLGQQLTYGELAGKASDLANSLRKRPLLPGEHVGVYMQRSPEMVIAIFAILMAGGVYLPLDPDYPSTRIQQMLEDASPRCVLTHAMVANQWPGTFEHLWLIDARQLKSSSVAPADVSVPQDAAYTIFTSGSTGRPKGATNTHAGIVNRIQWMQDAFHLDDTDIVLQKTPFSFDVSVWEFFWPLAVGAALEVAAPGAHRDPGALCQLIQETQVTTIHFVPSMLGAFLNHPLSSQCRALRRVIASGEALTPELVHRFTRRLSAALHNLYGPTEAAVDVTWWPCANDPDAAPVPIGRPIANTQIYILDACGEPVPIGVPGELYIAGVQVALGYVNRPELTAERFVSNSFAGDRSSRMYRTGDLAKWLPNGNIVYLGRTDGQVKLHGNRIELGEVEHALDACEGVQQSVVLLRETVGAERALVAYIRTVDDLPVTAQQLLLLRKALARRLPKYMIPLQFVAVPEFPLTASGKVDRKALPVPAVQRAIVQEQVSATTPMEVWLQTQLQELLNCGELSIAANLFDAGGNSITVAQLVGRVYEHHGLKVPLVKFFEHPTIARLAAYLVELAHGEGTSEHDLDAARAKARKRRELPRSNNSRTRR